jgi:hypothetical protein
LARLKIEALYLRTILKEFSRVARGEILVSLWVDGNLQASRRKKKEAKRVRST